MPIAIAIDRPTPYWQVNVPEEQRTVECPESLKGLNEKDIRTLSTPDSEFKMQMWPQISAWVKDNHLERFQRWPSQLRRYRQFMFKLKKEYGSVADFVLQKRVAWSEPIVPKAEPFECKDDYKILFNDWPYGFDPKVVHLVVWTKFRFEENPTNGDLSDKSRADIERFITKTFRSKIPEDKVSREKTLFETVRVCTNEVTVALVQELVGHQVNPCD